MPLYSKSVICYGKTFTEEEYIKNSLHSFGCKIEISGEEILKSEGYNNCLDNNPSNLEGLTSCVKNFEKGRLDIARTKKRLEAMRKNTELLNKQFKKNHKNIIINKDDYSSEIEELRNEIENLKFELFLLQND